MYAFAALLQPGDTLMGLEMNHGGHISHGYQTTNRKISEMAHKYNCVPYHVDLRTGLIDYDDLEKQANLLRPKLIIAGASAYSRLIDYVRMKKIADDSGALLLADMSHICGLVAAQVVPSPFSHCDIVTTTAYKTLRGPPSAVIFARKHFMKEIDRTVFPRFQCSTNVRHILGMATAFLQARLPESVAQQNMVIACAQILSDGLKRRGYRILGGGTDIHLLVVDLRGTGTDGARVEALLEICRVNTNRNVIPGEKPGSRMGIRFGTAPMVSRGFTMGHFAWFAEIVHRVIGLSVTISRDVEEQASEELTKRTSYQAFLGQMKGGKREESIAELREDVVRKAREYPTPW
jgi:glycine hydroxymethyltransferase